MELDQATGFGALVLRQSNVAAWRQRMGTQKPRNLSLIEDTVKALKLPTLRTVHPSLADVDAIFIREMNAVLFEGKVPDQAIKTVATEGTTLLGAK